MVDHTKSPQTENKLDHNVSGCVMERIANGYCAECESKKKKEALSQAPALTRAGVKPNGKE